MAPYIYFLPICVASCCVLQTAEIIKPIVVPQRPCNIVNKNIQNIDPSAGTFRGKKFKIIFAEFFPTYTGAEERFLSKGGPPNKKNEIWVIFKKFSP